MASIQMQINKDGIRYPEDGLAMLDKDIGSINIGKTQESVGIGDKHLALFNV